MPSPGAPLYHTVLKSGGPERQCKQHNRDCLGKTNLSEKINDQIPKGGGGG